MNNEMGNDEIRADSMLACQQPNRNDDPRTKAAVNGCPSTGQDEKRFNSIHLTGAEWGLNG